MQVSVESTGNIERKMAVSIPAERISQEVESRLKSLKGRVRIDGFRPGKVPLSVVKQRYGMEVLQEVAGEVMQSSFYDAASQEELRVAGYPSITPTKVELGANLEYDATFDVYPEIEIAAVDSLEISRPSADVTDADIDKMIETLREQQKDWAVVERAAANGDLVDVDFEGLLNGETFEGGKAEDFVVELGSGRMLADFEAALEGMSAGESKTADVTFPEDYQAENLKGKTVQFNIDVKQVREAALPEIDAEFMKRFGVEDGSDESFRAEVKKNMERELENRIKSAVKQQVMDGLFDLHEVDAPSALVKDEIGQVRQEMAQNAGNGMDLSTLPDELFSEQATRRVKLGLIVGEVIRQNDIKKDDERVETMLNSLAATYEDPNALIEYYRNNAQAMQTVEAAVMEEMIVEWVLDQAKVTDEAKDFDSIMNPEQAQA